MLAQITVSSASAFASAKALRFATALPCAVSASRKFSSMTCVCGKFGCLCWEKRAGNLRPYMVPKKSKMTQKATERSLETILSNNKKWVEETLRTDPEFFKKAGSVHKPKYLYFGCSDARVPANKIMGLEAGEVFVHRNIGNQIPVNDLNALSVLEYGVGFLGVTDIIVTGHYECGAIRAVTSRQQLGLLDTWLRLIKDVYRLHKDHIDAIESDEEKHRRLVELNVVEQCLNLYKTSIVQNKREQTALNQTEEGVYPRIHPMVFDPKEGILRSLKADLERRAAVLEPIYGYQNK